MSESSLIATVKGAVEGSVSVLLTLSAGYLVTRAGLLDRATTKKVSNVASLVFLPCLIIVQMGPELTPDLLSKVWILPVWGLVSTLIAHGFGWAGKSALKLPNWTIIAAGRPNSSALPLLLIEALSNTGVLDSLKRPDESTDDILSRAKSLILLNVVVQQIITFVAGPSILTGGNNKNDERRDRLLPGPSQGSRPSIQDTEHVGLLHDHNSEDGYGSIADPHRFERPLRELDNTPNFHWPANLQFLEKPAKTIGRFMNAPVVGALIAFTIGMIAPLHHAFLDEDGPLYNSLTKSVDNLGSLFVGLQMFIVGAQLATVPSSNPKVVPTVYVLSIRYIVMPALAVLFVFLTAGKGWYTDDPLVWFLLVLIPSGPSAMVLASLAELVDTDQGPVAGYLTIAYCFSPLIAIACAVGLAVVQSKTGGS